MAPALKTMLRVLEETELAFNLEEVIALFETYDSVRAGSHRLGPDEWPGRYRCRIAATRDGRDGRLAFDSPCH